MGVTGWPEVFRGSEAVAAGLVTWGRLRGPRFVRLFPDVHAPAGRQPPDLALRARAAGLFIGDRGAVSGWAAAELLGASCGPRDAPVEVTTSGARVRAHPGLVVRRERIAPGELTTVGGVRVTGALRTAYGLARRLDLVEGVVAVDRLTNRFRLCPDLLLNFLVRYPRAIGNPRVIDVLAHANPYSGSPMESRLRMVLELAGLPRPRVQWVVQDRGTRTALWLDLAYPQAKVGIEYEGEEHTTPEGVLRDAGRYTRLVDRGWRIYRYTKFDVRGGRGRIVAEVTRALGTPPLSGGS